MTEVGWLVCCFGFFWCADHEFMNGVWVLWVDLSASSSFSLDITLGLDGFDGRLGFGTMCIMQCVQPFRHSRNIYGTEVIIFIRIERSSS